MEKFLNDIGMSLGWTSIFVFAIFSLLFLSRRLQINWLTKLLTSPSNEKRPPSWIVVTACATLLALSLTWFFLTPEQRQIVQEFVSGSP